MTEKEKRRIKELRLSGIGYKAIAKELDLSESTISSFCRRSRLSFNANISYAVCKECGGVIPINPKAKKRIFCSTKCSTAWWNKHRDLKKPRKPFTFICRGCRAETESYGNHNRKYCSHKCYISSRYAKGGDCGE